MLKIKEWRPDDWEDRHKQHWYPADFRIFEAGASAMFVALLKWLDEPCKEHPKDPNHYDYWLPEHRYLCPQCMSELKEPMTKGHALEG